MVFIVDKFAEQTKMITDIILRDSTFDDEEVKNFIITEAESKLVGTPCELFNNYNNKRSKTDMVKFLDWYDKKKPIPCEHGVFFKKHDEAMNLNASFVTSLLDNRKIAKKKMFECEKAGDQEGVKKYNTEQKVFKVFANSYYGAQGQSSSIFYNLFTALSVTGRGQSVISCASTTFERFLSNNVKFMCMDDCLYFIANVVNEERTFKDEDVLDTNISKKDLILYLADQFEEKKECIDNLDVLKAMVSKLTQEEVNRVYLKNNLYAFLKNKRPFILIEEMIRGCDSFTDAMDVPETIAGKMDEFWELLKEFVYYDVPVYDRVTWLKTRERKSVITVDTDSNFLNLEPFYDFVLENASFSIDMTDWDTAYKIISIMGQILGRVIAAAYWTFTRMSNVPEEKRPIISMKNEFLYKRILLTTGKKNYAGYMLTQEGVAIPDKKALDIKGLPIKKANVNRNTGTFLMDLLKEDILKSDTIQTKALLQKLTNFENEVKECFKNRQTTYMTPGKANQIESYKAPYQQAAVRASLAYNAIHPENPINFPAQVNMVKCKGDSLDKIAYIYDTHPEVYRALKEQVFEDENLGKYGITYFAIPKTDEEIPEWLIPIIDVDTIIQDNLNNFLKILNSIGLKTVPVNASSEFFSNVIEF